MIKGFRNNIYEEYQENLEDTDWVNYLEPGMVELSIIDNIYDLLKLIHTKNINLENTIPFHTWDIEYRDLVCRIIENITIWCTYNGLNISDIFKTLTKNEIPLDIIKIITQNYIDNHSFSNYEIIKSLKGIIGSILPEPRHLNLEKLVQNELYRHNTKNSSFSETSK